MATSNFSWVDGHGSRLLYHNDTGRVYGRVTRRDSAFAQTSTYFALEGNNVIGEYISIIDAERAVEQAVAATERMTRRTEEDPT